MALISGIFTTLSLLSPLVLFVLYVIHIFIEGSEKLKFIPIKTHNKVKNEIAGKVGIGVNKDACRF